MGHLVRWALVPALVLGLGQAAAQDDDGRVYFSGMLVFGDESRCGLVKIYVMDHASCRIPDTFCRDNPKLLNQRIRLSAKPARCGASAVMRCSSDGGDFYESSFIARRCYDQPQLVRMLGL